MDSVIEEKPSFFVGSFLPFCFRCGTVFVGFLSIAVGLLYAKQDKLLYFPEIGARKNKANPRGYRSPEEHDQKFETHMIRTADGLSIHSWLLLHDPPRDNGSATPTIVFFHGNAGNIGARLHNGVTMCRVLRANVLMVEYRGYGDSDDAAPNEAGLKLDGEAALRFVLSHEAVDPSLVYLFGRSLGGAVAFHVAWTARRDGVRLAGVVVENTFTSISDMVDVLMPLVAPFKRLVLRIDWDSVALVDRLRDTPVLYLAGSDDELVPHAQMRALLARTPDARMHVIEGGTHNDSWVVGGRAYWERFRAFVEETSSSGNRDVGRVRRSSSSVGSVDDLAREETAATGDGGVAVDMGVEVEASSSNTKGAIPIMPGNFMGIAREAGKKKKL